MATGEKFERHGGAAEHKLHAQPVRGTGEHGAGLCRETATSPADRRDSDRIDVTGFTPVTGHAHIGD